MLFELTNELVLADKLDTAVVYLGLSSQGTDEIAGRGTDKFGVINITFSTDLDIGEAPPANATLVMVLKFLVVERIRRFNPVALVKFINTWKALIPNRPVDIS